MTERSTVADANQPPTTNRSLRATIAGGVGSVLEFYDYTLYGYLAIVLAPQFFPASDPVSSLLAALGVFAVGYVARPLGGIAFGYIGDRRGRRTALIGSVILMGAASVVIGLLPTFAQIGAGASVLLLLARLAQGFAAGGETAGASTLIAESTSGLRRAIYGAWTPIGSLLGFVLAASVVGLMTALTSAKQMSDWGWRLPFLASVVIIAIALWLRMRTDETANLNARPKRSPILEVLRDHRGSLALVIALAIAVNGAAFIPLAYSSIHLIQRLGYKPAAVYWIVAAAIAISCLPMPFIGMLADRLGNRRVAAAGMVGYILLTFPGLALMGLDNLGLAFVGLLLIIVNNGFVSVPVYTEIPFLFPQSARYTGVSLGWNIGVILAGATAPLAAVWLIEQTGIVTAPGFWVIGVSLIGLIGLAIAAGRLGPKTEVTGSESLPAR
ncbi:glycine betaine/L-proline transporter ProP [Kribbella yunnanensis]|uniref:Glycine betaine/L-proline transporter ProP n=1 Tax=Kribbella yunnanensis TaxID=190194 RepID=A0ABP4UJN8_9ACTN